MNLNQLRYFVSVCKYNNITIASKNIHVSQPSITASIKELEIELGYQLFDRVNNRISLTSEGKEFFKIAEKFLINYDDFYALALDIGGAKEKVLRVGIPSVLGTFFLKKIVPNFIQTNPDIRLMLYEVPTFEGVKMIKEADLDLFIGIMDEEFCSDCEVKFLFVTYPMLAVSTENALSKEDSITKKMLIDQPLVIIPKGSYHYKFITEMFSDIPLNIILQSNQLSTIRFMVENNYAATIIYKEIFENDPRVCTVPLEEMVPIKVGVFWHKNTYISSAKQSFIQYMHSIKYP